MILGNENSFGLNLEQIQKFKFGVFEENVVKAVFKTNFSVFFVRKIKVTTDAKTKT